jgi:hypothetical protein
MTFRIPALSSQKRSRTALIAIVVAGLIGGTAEVVWVTLYSAFTSADAAVVAREIVYSLPFAGARATAANGVAIHLTLSVVLAFAFGLLLWHPLLRRAGLAVNVVFACAALALVWVINFGVVLPVMNPIFVDLLPYAVTFISKLLFGAAMGVTLYRLAGRPVHRHSFH